MIILRNSEHSAMYYNDSIYIYLRLYSLSPFSCKCSAATRGCIERSIRKKYWRPCDTIDESHWQRGKRIGGPKNVTNRDFAKSMVRRKDASGPDADFDRSIGQVRRSAFEEKLRGAFADELA